MADLQKLVDELSRLTVLEAAELSKLLEEQVGRFGCRTGRGPRRQRRPRLLPRRLKSKPNSVSCSKARQEDQCHQGGPYLTSLGLKEAKDLVEAAPKG